MPTSPDCIVAPVEHLSYNVASAPTAAESDRAVWQWLRFLCVTEQTVSLLGKKYLPASALVDAHIVAATD